MQTWILKYRRKNGTEYSLIFNAIDGAIARQIAKREVDGLCATMTRLERI